MNSSRVQATRWPVGALRCTVNGGSKLNRSVSPEKLPNSSHADQLIGVRLHPYLASDWPKILRSSESAAKKKSILYVYTYTYCTVPVDFFLDFSTVYLRRRCFMLLVHVRAHCTAHVRKYFRKYVDLRSCSPTCTTLYFESTFVLSYV